MHIRVYSLRVLAIFLFNESFAFNITNQNESLAEYACNLTKDIIISQSHTQDVLIGNLGGKMESEIINQLIGCIGHENPVVVTDLNSKINEKDLRKASIVVLVVDTIYVVRKILFLN